jgi:hypothetical protein
MKSLVVGLITLVIGAAVGSGARAYEAPSNEEYSPPDDNKSSPLDRPGLDFALRLGFAYPFGKLAGSMGGASTDISEVLSGTIPLGLELGYRINSIATVGLLFQYAFGLTKNCDPGLSCSGSDVRLGIEGLFHIPVDEGPFVPWLGLGAGYEWLSLDVSANGTDMSTGFHGFEFVNLQVGVDYRIRPRVSLGPFVSLSLARYDTVTGESGGNSGSADIPDKALHEWLQFGMKATFNL